MTENPKTEIIYEEVRLPEVAYEGSDRKLLELITKLKAGTFRILVFTVVGLIMGWFSVRYYTDTFIVTKVIFAIPYKISEAIYVSIIGTGNTLAQTMAPAYLESEFFSQSFIATFLAERITPVLIGGAIYGCLGYFTGDKRVFTLPRFIKFICAHAVILAVFIGIVYGVNAKAVYDNDHLIGVQYFGLECETHGETITGDRAEVMKEALERGLEQDASIEQDAQGEIPIQIIYAGGWRAMRAFVNVEACYLVTENGSTYRVSEEFCGYVQEYEETGSLMGVQTFSVREEGEDEGVTD